MSAFEELTDGLRAQLMGELSRLVDLEADTRLKSCLWLADIENLEELIRIAREEKGFALIPLRGSDDATRMLNAWAHRPRVMARKRKVWSSRSHSPSKLPTMAGINVGNVPTTAILPANESDGVLDHSEVARELCFERDKGTCPVTHRRSIVEAAHIFPSSLGLCDKITWKVFWAILRHFWSEEKVNTWENAVLADGTETCYNLICLSPDVHMQWRKATFALKPLDLTEDKKAMKAQFFWLPQPYNFHENRIKVCAELHVNQATDCYGNALYNQVTRKNVRSGDAFLFETEDPVGHPLPSWPLLEMQWYLHRLLAISGTAQSIKYDSGLDIDTEIETDMDEGMKISDTE